MTQAIVEALPGIVEGIRGVVDFLSDIEGEWVAWGASIAGIFAASGPILLGIGGFVTAITAILTFPAGVIAALLAGAVAAWFAWGDDIKSAIGRTITGIREAFNGLTEWWTEFWTVFGERTIEVVSAPLDWILNKVASVTEGVIGRFLDMADAVTFGSIVPDMMSSIVKQFDAGLSAMERATAGSAGVTTANFERMAQDNVSLYGWMAGSMVQLGKQLFGESKVLNIAMAIIDTARGITLALATIPPPAGWAAAAVTAAMGAAQIATIASSSMGGGGSSISRPSGSASAISSSGSAGAITGGAAPTPPPTTDRRETAADDEPERSRVVTVQLESRRNVFTREDIENIFDGINDMIEDGAKLKLA